MKKLFTAIAISMSALMATTAMAAPQHSQDHRDSRYQSSKAAPHWNNKHQDARFDRHDRFERNDRSRTSINPSREWRTGQTLPRQYSTARFEANRDQVKRLPKAGRNQQWYNIGGDYVLVNERNDRILKIIG